MISNTTPVFAVDEKNLVPVSDHLAQMMDIPPSRMFLINKSLKTYKDKFPEAPIYDASQGDGGASLPGTPKPLLERALQLQLEHGTAYDMPFGTDAYRKSVIEKYWKLNSASGWGPANVLGTAGGRDALVKAYQADAGSRSRPTGRPHHGLARAMDLLQLGAVWSWCERLVDSG